MGDRLSSLSGLSLYYPNSCGGVPAAGTMSRYGT